MCAILFEGDRGLNKQEYLDRQAARAETATKYRNLCVTCLQPEFGCYCTQVQKLDPKIKFVILIHPIEHKRRIATGRMSHLCLKNSELITGQDYSANQRVNAILEDHQNSCKILYPSKKSLNLTKILNQDSSRPPAIFEQGKLPVVFVIDGTWATAVKTLRQSRNLQTLSQICFTPSQLSQFRVRKQPAKEYVSTIEAIHHTIELLGPGAGFKTEQREHDKLLNVFNYMVERQLEFIRKASLDPNFSAYRRPRLPLVS